MWRDLEKENKEKDTLSKSYSYQKTDLHNFDNNHSLAKKNTKYNFVCIYTMVSMTSLRV